MLLRDREQAVLERARDLLRSRRAADVLPPRRLRDLAADELALVPDDRDRLPLLAFLPIVIALLVTIHKHFALLLGTGPGRGVTQPLAPELTL